MGFTEFVKKLRWTPSWSEEEEWRLCYDCEMDVESPADLRSLLCSMNLQLMAAPVWVQVRRGRGGTTSWKHLELQVFYGAAFQEWRLHKWIYVSQTWHASALWFQRKLIVSDYCQLIIPSSSSVLHLHHVSALVSSSEDGGPTWSRIINDVQDVNFLTWLVDYSSCLFKLYLYRNHGQNSETTDGIRPWDRWAEQEVFNEAGSDIMMETFWWILLQQLFVSSRTVFCTSTWFYLSTDSL